MALFPVYKKTHHSCGATISLSGTAAVPGNEHAKTATGGEPIGKLIDIKVFCHYISRKCTPLF